MKRILIVDDNAHIRKKLRESLEESGMEIIEAATKERARQHFAENPDFFAILMDGWLDPSSDTCDLIEEFRQTFTGYIVAMSTDEALLKRQIIAGCSHSMSKERVSELVIQLAQD